MTPRPHVENDALTLAMVPAADAAWAEVVTFGHMFHAYKVAGSVQRVSELAAEANSAWLDDGTLPKDLTKLRVVLFATARALAHDQVTDDDRAWPRALVAAIRDALPTG